jgi:hypothetical protein
MRFALSLSLLISLLATSCASVPDVMICTEITMTKGFCTRTISDEEVIIDDAHPYTFEEGGKPMTWWELRVFMVLAPIPSWKEIKAYIIKTCKRDNCNAMVKSWDRKIQGLDSHLPTQP